MMKKKLSFITVVSILIGMGMLVNCSVNDNPSKMISKAAGLLWRFLGSDLQVILEKCMF